LHFINCNVLSLMHSKWHCRKRRWGGHPCQGRFHARWSF